MEMQKVKYPIGLKMVMIVAVLVVLVLGFSTAMVVYMVSRDSEAKAKDTNLTLNEVTAQTVENWMVNMQNNSLGFFNDSLLSQNKKSADSMFEDFCYRNPDIWFIQAPEFGMKVSPHAEVYKADAKKAFKSWMNIHTWAEEKARKGDVSVLNLTSVMEQPSVCIFFPYEVNGKNDCAVVGFRVTKLVELMTNSRMNTSVIMDSEGQLLISADIENAENEGYVQAAAKAVQNAKIDNAQVIESDASDTKWEIAYKKLAGGIYAVTCVSEESVLQTIRHTAYRIVLISMAILFLAILLIRHFSKTLTRPILELAGAAQKIEKGDFSLDITPKTQDEIGLLTKNFVAMSNGLGNFMKFTNKTLVEQSMKGSLGLGGERREATIFFSDIRSFTAMSEKLTPNEVVEFLNEYMTKMVSCVVKTHGTVDKYIGDAVMAVWGCPDSAGSPAADAWNAVVGALMMRTELYKLNQKREKEGKSKIQIGCGINTGSVVAGQIGSDVRMEYTVIGDAVNLASRTESLNKPFQTDILITENTYKLIGKKLIVEEMPSVHVKGKEDAIRMYAVVNIKGVKGVTTLAEVRKLMGFHDIDKSQVNTDEEEKKYKIGE
ncbi:MAG: HAMP domain-containing protein [Treponema sp.]|nr:HAMP domain-containing protein [Treponema sp.]